MRPIAVTVLVAALLAGCSGPASPPSPVPTASSAPHGGPLALVGSWRMEGTDDVLRLDGDGTRLSLWRACGTLRGDWRADGTGLFVGAVTSISGCPPPPTGQPWTPAWLAVATGYRLDGPARELLDPAGRVVARLLPGGRPVPVDPTVVDPSAAEPPAVTDADRRALTPAAPLPATLTPATPVTLAGRWVAGDGVHRPREAGVELRPDGSWAGSDGCNYSGGRWIAGTGGALLATSGTTTLIACDNHPAARWLTTARRAAVDGRRLVLFDAGGKELGRLTRG